ncbi:adoMet-dependent rRNA methyltransferase SPB1, partial [Tanacetum coccineum]
VSLDDNEPTEEEISAKWFSQDAFDDDNEQKHIKMDLSEDKEDEEEDEMHMDKKPDNQIMPIKPIKKEEINAMKAQFKEINAWPTKKVAQAKARKKHVALRNMEKV